MRRLYTAAAMAFLTLEVAAFQSKRSGSSLDQPPLARLPFKTAAPIRKVMSHVYSQMAALARVNQVLEISAFRITFA
jgi:hypothetical protein